jgi:peroxiredoxin Q/BCP
VSSDKAADQSAFASKYKLPFVLLADTERKAVNAYGVWGKRTLKDGSEYEGILRSTFLIDPQGRLVKEWRGVKVDGHVEEVLSSI